MSKPWDRPPGPLNGDKDSKDTYAGVGLVLSHWEEIEVRLSYIYAAFAGRPTDTQTIHEYGKPNTFALRASGLSAQAAAYFRGHPSQENEGTFDGLLEECLGYSARRNEIAHGIVRETLFAFVPDPNHPSDIQHLGRAFSLSPPYYDGKRFSPHNLMEAEYFYSSVEMDQLTQKLRGLRGRLNDYYRSLVGKQKAQP